MHARRRRARLNDPTKVDLAARASVRSFGARRASRSRLSWGLSWSACLRGSRRRLGRVFDELGPGRGLVTGLALHRELLIDMAWRAVEVVVVTAGAEARRTTELRRRSFVAVEALCLRVCAVERPRRVGHHRRAPTLLRVADPTRSGPRPDVDRVRGRAKILHVAGRASLGARIALREDAAARISAERGSSEAPRRASTPRERRASEALRAGKGIPCRAQAARIFGSRSGGPQ